MVFDNMVVAMKVKGSDVVSLVMDVFVATNVAEIGWGILTNMVCRSKLSTSSDSCLASKKLRSLLMVLLCPRQVLFSSL